MRNMVRRGAAMDSENLLDNPYWTIDQALLWIAIRDMRRVKEWITWSKNGGVVPWLNYAWGAADKLEFIGPLHPNEDFMGWVHPEGLNAPKRLLHALQMGRLRGRIGRRLLEPEEFEPPAQFVYETRSERTELRTQLGEHAELRISDPLSIVTLFPMWPAEPSDGASDSSMTSGLAGEAATVSTSGVAGRPTSLHLILEEMSRRKRAGETFTSIKALADAMADWVASEHPRSPRTGSKALQNNPTFASLARSMTIPKMASQK